MSPFRIVVLLALASVAMATTPAPVDTVALQAEVDALRKESDLLTSTLADNWDAFKTSCGKVLDEKCADVAKVAEAQVLAIQAKKEQGAKDQQGSDSGSGSGSGSGPGRRLGGKRHGGKHDHGKHGGEHGGEHGGKHGHGKHGGKKEMPVFVEATFCVLKANALAQTTAPNTNLVCDRSAKRFELYNNIHHPPEHAGHGRRHGPPMHSFLAALVGAIMACLGIKMCKCCRARCKKKGLSSATVTNIQATSSEHVVMGEPVIVTQKSYTIKQ